MTTPAFHRAYDARNTHEIQGLALLLNAIPGDPRSGLLAAGDELSSNPLEQTNAPVFSASGNRADPGALGLNVHSTTSEVSDDEFAALYSATMIDIIIWLAEMRKSRRQISQMQIELISKLVEKQAEQMRKAGAERFFSGMMTAAFSMACAGVQMVSAIKGLKDVKMADDALQNKAPKVDVLGNGGNNKGPGVKVVEPNLKTDAGAGTGTKGANNLVDPKTGNAVVVDTNATNSATKNVDPSTNKESNVYSTNNGGENKKSTSGTDQPSGTTKEQRLQAKRHLARSESHNSIVRSVSDFANALSKIFSGISDLNANAEDARRKETEGNQQVVSTQKESLDQLIREDQENVSMVLNAIKEYISMDREISSAINSRIAA